MNFWSSPRDLQKLDSQSVYAVRSLLDRRLNRIGRVEIRTAVGERDEDRNDEERATLMNGIGIVGTARMPRHERSLSVAGSETLVVKASRLLAVHQGMVR